MKATLILALEVERVFPTGILCPGAICTRPGTDHPRRERGHAASASADPGAPGQR